MTSHRNIHFLPTPMKSLDTIVLSREKKVLVLAYNTMSGSYERDYRYYDLFYELYQTKNHMMEVIFHPEFHASAYNLFGTSSL